MDDRRIVILPAAQGGRLKGKDNSPNRTRTDPYPTSCLPTTPGTP